MQCSQREWEKGSVTAVLTALHVNKYVYISLSLSAYLTLSPADGLVRSDYPFVKQNGAPDEEELLTEVVF